MYSEDAQSSGNCASSCDQLETAPPDGQATADPGLDEMPCDPDYDPWPPEDPMPPEYYETREDEGPWPEEAYEAPQDAEYDPTPDEYYEWRLDHPDYPDAACSEESAEDSDPEGTERDGIPHDDHAGDASKGEQSPQASTAHSAPDGAPPGQAKNNAASGLRAWSAEDYLARRFPPKEPLVTGLLHRRDLVAFGARRRNGKTSLVTNLAVAGAVPVGDFLGYKIPAPWRSLLFILEDDPGEYQEKLRKVIGTRDTAGRLKIVTREDFYEGNIRIDVRDQAFRDAVESSATVHCPDLIVLDNLAQVIGAEYNESKLVHILMQFCYRLARLYNAAVILPAHPKKEDPKNRVSLLDNPDAFFESIMGSSHFINSTGSLWGLERSPQADQSTFVGGRQRGDGNQGASYLSMDADGWFSLIDEAHKSLPLALNTPVRQQAWVLLPNPPATFGYREGEALVKSVMRSSSTYDAWIKHCKRLKVIVDTPDGKLTKAPGQNPPGADLRNVGVNGMSV